MILTLSYGFLCLINILNCIKPLPIRMIREPFEIVSLIWIHNDLTASVPREPVGSQVWHEALLLMHFIQFHFALFFLFLLCFKFFPLIVLKVRFFELAHSPEVSFRLRSSREFRIRYLRILLPFNDPFKHQQTRAQRGFLFSRKLIDPFESILNFIEIHVPDIAMSDI